MIHRDIPGHEQILAPAAILEFSDDLRVADVSPLRNFLAARLGELARDQEEGTDARWASEHLARTIDAACRDLADALVSWEIELTEGDIGRPGHVQRLRQNLATGWDRLVQTAQRFAGHSDYLPRWRPLRYCCVEHAEFVEQALGDATDSGILHSGSPGHDD
ncbi:hypothetical protein ABZV65_16555 [Streptomyces bauhiniae]|uniref:hypothetical protein n=1 Tax=Streptomyces bauhiniae TaxID=2340725 RepID=UPI0033AD6F7A